MAKDDQSYIQLAIEMDENRIPEKLQWRSSDGPDDTFRECAAFLLSIWDPGQRETLKIDLWNKDMRQDEMDQLFFQTFLTMADTYERANQKKEVADKIRAFAYRFGEENKIIKRAEPGSQK